jgi:hypothetical protein
MPKRDTAPTEELKPQHEVAETTKTEEVSHDGSSVIFTEKELRGMEYPDLDGICSIYKIDIKADGTKNTKAKYAKAILASQTAALAETNTTPAELMKFAKSYEVQGLPMLQETQMGSVSYSIGLTKNLGNYESMKLSATVELPLEPTQADIEKAKKTLSIAKELVLGALEADLSSIDIDSLRKNMQ